RLSGNVQQTWLVEWLTSHGGAAGDDKALRRMPDLAIAKPEAEAIAAWLLRMSPDKSEQKSNEQKETKATKSDSAKKADAKGSKKGREEKPKPSVEEGERLVLTQGCLACHKLGQLGESGL